MRRRLARAAVVVGLAGATVAAPLLAAAAVPGVAGSSAWSATAAADGVRVGVVVDDFLVVSNVVDAGGPAAQAVLTSFGGSQAYAAYPYPGEIVLTAHGLSQGAAPDYPLIAQSNATQPRSDVDEGPYQLHARTADDTSSAVAQAGAGGGGLAAGTTQSTATVDHDPASGRVTADAETTLEGLSVAGVLHIGRLHSHASVVSTPGKPPLRRSDTEAADVEVAGQQVGVTDKGLVLAGTDVPLPPDSTANAALSAAGVTVHYLAASGTGGSLAAPALSVSVAQDVPGVGETTVTYLLGGAAVTAQASGAVDGTGTTTTLLPSAGSSTAPPSGATGGAPPTGDTGGFTAPPPASQGSAGSVPVTAPALTGSASGYRLAASPGASSASLYLVVASGAIVMVAAAQLFRLLAVRLTWT